MELFSSPWWSALLAIILIDLVLAGDNAIVIALAARKLPPQLQKRAIAWGMVGAIVVRAVMTVGVVWLLRIPGLQLAGGFIGIFHGMSERDVMRFLRHPATMLETDGDLVVPGKGHPHPRSYGAFDSDVIGIGSLPCRAKMTYVCL